MSSFIPVGREVPIEEAFPKRPIAPTSKKTHPNYYRDRVAQEKRARSQGFFKKGLERLKGLFSSDREDYTIEEIDELTSYFQRAILFLNEEKLQKKKQKR